MEFLSASAVEMLPKSHRIIIQANSGFDSYNIVKVLGTPKKLKR